MKKNLNHQVTNIEISGIRQFFNLVSNKKDIISLTIGQPDFPTPEHIKQAAKHAINMNYTTYTHNAGITPLRQAVAMYMEEKYNLTYRSEDEVIVTVGASQAIDITLRTILTEGDEVILPGPIYPGYEPLITLTGAKTVFVDTTTSGFKLTKELLRQHISPKTKCLILPYPSNPTGVSYTKKELSELVEELKQRNIFILSDEIYSELNYEGKHYSIARFEEIKDKTIVINGLSKSHAMTGWRIGFLLAPRWLSEHILKVHQYNVSCATSISQYAALEALTNGKNDAIYMRNEYRSRRDYVYDRLTKMGLEVTKPDGAFYFFPKLALGTMSSFELGIKLLEEAKLALVPGDAFSKHGQGYMRLSYAYDRETLEKGLDRLENFIQKK
ncbi:aminotransferase A [Aquibacillus sp. 3ASR75-11]|uniref:Aminotransferase n=1 Tax=Terrihalobacillus insolitus TaxID=2950438 RepID=A0A9X4AMR8_9BACI|nr:aminotransferase A [Terrihalobacillus insolitus]MDC3412748.1 aminotransferase A [Terrihalobacillus insolitus]MDC3423775.1 aminotransferase A [Terrihalobacillus insolitus]